MTDQPSTGCWWTISETDLRAMLAEAAAGADPEVVYVTHYANSEHEHDQW